MARPDSPSVNEPWMSEIGAKHHEDVAGTFFGGRFIDGCAGWASRGRRGRRNR